MRLLIIGAGGHAQVVADILLTRSKLGEPIELVGFIDDDIHKQGNHILGAQILGPMAQLDQVEHDAIVIAIGNNIVRRQLFNKLNKLGERFATVIHPQAIVAADVTIGRGTMIVAGAIINTGSHIGTNCIINTGATVDHHNQIGNHVHVAPGVTLGGEVHVDDGAFLGIGSTVLPRCKIGTMATIGGGALVNCDIAAKMTVVGIPAKPLSKPDHNVGEVCNE